MTSSQPLAVACQLLQPHFRISFPCIMRRKPKRKDTDILHKGIRAESCVSAKVAIDKTCQGIIVSAWQANLLSIRRPPRSRKRP